MLYVGQNAQKKEDMWEYYSCENRVIRIKTREGKLLTI